MRCPYCDKKADKFILWRIVVVVLAFAALAGVFSIIGAAMEDEFPPCQEDEAWWWVGVDQRGCVPMDDILILEGGECG